jgi:hypothetical protein
MQARAFIVVALTADALSLSAAGLAGVGIFFQQHPDSHDVFVRSMVHCPSPARSRFRSSHASLRYLAAVPIAAAKFRRLMSSLVSTATQCVDALCKS